jgi:hypothetical protein
MSGTLREQNKLHRHQQWERLIFGLTVIGRTIVRLSFLLADKKGVCRVEHARLACGVSERAGHPCRVPRQKSVRP